MTEPHRPARRPARRLLRWIVATVPGAQGAARAVRDPRLAVRRARNRLDRLRTIGASAARARRLEVEVALLRRQHEDHDRREGAAAAGGPDLAARLHQHLLGREPAAPLDRVPSSVVEAITDVGRLLLPGHDRFVTPPLRDAGTWEPLEGALIDQRVHAGMVCLDVGAHVGYHTVRMARAVGPSGRVVAFEPAPQNYALLCANLARHGLDQVLPIEAAVSRASGEVELTLSPDNTGGNRAYRLHYVAPDLQATAVALDELLPAEAKIDFVKVDVEGMDHAAIEGMEHMIRRCHPVIVAEFSPSLIAYVGDDPIEVVGYYRRLGYEVSVLEAPELPRMASAESIVELTQARPTGYVNLVLDPSWSTASG